MSNLRREQLASREGSSHPLEGLVVKSIARLEKLFSTKGNLAEDGRELLSWWKEAKTLLNMHVTENQIVHRFRAAFAQKSLSPLFEPHLTEDQYERMSDSFETYFKDILKTCENFINGPGLMTANSVVAKELTTAKDEMRRLHSRLFNFNSQRKTR